MFAIKNLKKLVIFMKKKILILILPIVVGVFLSACATNGNANGSTLYQPAMQTNKTTASYYSSARYSQPMSYANMPVKLNPPKKRRVGIDAVNYANSHAVRQPSSVGYINSIMTFDFVDGALYQIYCAPMNVTDIEFQTGEHLISVAAGDTVRWQVSKTFSGGGANRHEHLLVKPNDEGLSNSLVITTDQRTYHILLHSTSRTYMPSVQWHYPQTDMVQNFDDGGAASALSSVGQSFDVNHLDFGYKVKLKNGPRPEWFPIAVFNDGNKTYIELPKKIQEAPTLFIGKTARIINYRMMGNYFVIDSLFPLAQLRAGQSVVQINYQYHN